MNDLVRHHGLDATSLEDATPLDGTKGTSSPSLPPSVTAAIGLLSGAIMVFQIALTRVFSFSIWHHFSFMVISIALLGFAVSGVALRLRPDLGEPVRLKAARYASLFAVTAVVAIPLLSRLTFDPTRLAHAPSQLLHLGGYYLALGIPFTFAGLAIVGLLKGFANRASRLYGSDLVGAGLGSTLAVPVLAAVGAEGAILASAALGLAAAGLLAWPGASRRSVAVHLGLVGLLAVGAVRASQLLSIPPGPGKGLHALLDRRSYPEAELVHTEWNAISRIDVVKGSAIITWTANLEAGVLPPAQTLIVIDGDAATPVTPWDGDLRSLSFLDHMLSAAGLAAYRPERTLVIGAGGGVDVLAALFHGARRVDAVEVNPAIVRLTRGPLAALSGGLFAREDVKLHLAEGRSFVRESSERYDAIQLSLVDTWAASVSGAYSLAEGYLYTVEAFGDYLDHLTPNGFVSIARWMGQPPRESLKLCSVAIEALRRRGASRPAEHIVVLGEGTVAAMLVRPRPFSAAELATLEQVGRERGFTILFAAGRRVAPNPFSVFFDNPAGLIAAYPYDISPSTDDRPFFFQFGRWRDAWTLGPGFAEHPLALSGRMLLLAVVVQAGALSAVLLVLPLAVTGGKGRRETGKGRVLAYFFLIGVAFMFVEISLMQQLTLLLGHPVYALALVLAVVLLAAGLGSMAAPRLAPITKRPDAVFLGITVMTLLHAIALPWLLAQTLAASFGTRLALSAALVAPLGFLLGIPMPAALARLVERHAEEMVGWAWAANGCGSVLGPILAAVLAIDLGFVTTTALAGIGYALAYFTFDWRKRRADDSGLLERRSGQDRRDPQRLVAAE